MKNQKKTRIFMVFFENHCENSFFLRLRRFLLQKNTFLVTNSPGTTKAQNLTLRSKGFRRIQCSHEFSEKDASHTSVFKLTRSSQMSTVQNFIHEEMFLMKNLLFCYTFSLKAMKLMVWLRCSALGEASQKYPHILQKVANHVLAHGGIDFLDISMISQRNTSKLSVLRPFGYRIFTLSSLQGRFTEE